MTFARFFRRYGATAAWITAAAGAGAFLYLDRNKPTTSEVELRKRRLLPSLRSDQVTSVDVQRDGVRFRLVRRARAGEGGASAEPAWELVRGAAREPADEAAADRLLSTLEYASPERRIAPESADRTTFGLDAPRLQVDVTTKRGIVRLAVGGPAVRPDDAVYVEAEGQFAVVRKETLGSVDVDVDTFRERVVMPYVTSDLKALRLEGEGGDRPFVYDQALKKWRFAPNTQSGLRLDRAVFERMQSAFADARADRFLLDEEADRAQAATSTVTLTMTPRDAGKPDAVLRVGGVCPGAPDDTVIVRTSPSRSSSCVGAGVFVALRVPAAEWVDKHALYAREDEIELVRATVGASVVLEVARKGSGWRQRTPRDEDVPADRMKPLVSALAKASANDLLAPSTPFGEARASVAIESSSAGAEGPAELVTLGPERPDGTTIVRREQDGALLVMGREAASAFVIGPAMLRPRTVVDLAPERARRLEVRGEGRRQIVERGEDGVWKLRAPAGIPVDAGVVADMVEAVSHLSAERWVTGTDEASFGLRAPLLEVDLATDDATKPGVKIAIGAATTGGYFARREGDLAVFVVARELKRTLEAWAFDRSAFAIDAQTFASIDARHGSAHVTLVAHDGRYEATGSAAATPARLEAATAALHDLRADTALHPGGPRPGEGFDHPQLELTARSKTSPPRRVVVGASGSYRDAAIVYARRDGIDATYALPAAGVRALLDLF